MAAYPERILSLCSGIGGLDLGVHAALRGNSRTIMYCEREAYAAAVLAARANEGKLDDAPVWSDIHTLEATCLRGKVDAIIGGYPCQSISSAGKRNGENDARWLWPEFFRIIKETNASWCFFENVANHVNIGLESVWRDLQSMGFEVEAGLFEAAEAGACHIRRRLFVFAYADSAELRLQSRRRKGRGTNKSKPPDNGQKRNVADSNSKGELQQNRSIDPLRGRPVNVRAKSLLGQWRKKWGSGTQICRVDDGVPNRMDRLRALGNGVVPACAEYAFRTLVERSNLRQA